MNNRSRTMHYQIDLDNGVDTYEGISFTCSTFGDEKEYTKNYMSADGYFLQHNYKSESGMLKAIKRLMESDAFSSMKIRAWNEDGSPNVGFTPFK